MSPHSSRDLVKSHLVPTGTWTWWMAALGLSLLVVGCRSPMSARRDASVVTDARLTDVLPDVSPNAVSDAEPTHGADATVSPPKAFRFINETGRPAYISLSPAVACRTLDSAGGWLDCGFWRDQCSLSCDGLAAGLSCCAMCDQPLPKVLYVPAGQSVSIAWDGKIFIKDATLCSACACEHGTSIPAGSYQAQAFAFPGYRCESGDCLPGSDGVIDKASPTGASTAITSSFSIPPFDGDEIILDINILSVPDAAIAADGSADMPSPKDAVQDAVPTTLDGLPGHTFEIAAADTPPDASVQGSVVCKAGDTSAHYALAFSSDGSKVQITRTDPVQEQIVNGTLLSRSDTRLVYDLTNLFAGGQLTVQMVDGKLVAQYVVFGSGVPVINCIQATMTSL